MGCGYWANNTATKNVGFGLMIYKNAVRRVDTNDESCVKNKT